MMFFGTESEMRRYRNSLLFIWFLAKYHWPLQMVSMTLLLTFISGESLLLCSLTSPNNKIDISGRLFQFSFSFAR
jgi:hypothetical protein